MSRRALVTFGARFAVSTALATFALGACTKSSPPSPAGEATDATAATSAAPKPSAAPLAAGPATWTGTYEATPGTLYVPDGGEWSGVKFHGDDAGTGLGAGTFALTVDAASGRAEGTAAGPLGDLLVRGLVREGSFSARLEPKDVTAGGFTGFALGKVEGDAIHGTMRLSTDTGNVIREGTFTLAKK